MQKRPNILIIEPRQDVRTFLEMTLCHEGMRVFSAMNLGSALLQLRVLESDLIIIGNGREALDAGDAVAKIKALSLSPLLALGHGNGVAAWPGIAAALPYPLGAGQLCAEVSRLLGGQVQPVRVEPRKAGMDGPTDHPILGIVRPFFDEVEYEGA